MFKQIDINNEIFQSDSMLRFKTLEQRSMNIGIKI